MGSRTFGVDIKLEGGASIAALRPENLTVAPVAPFMGQMYFNIGDKKTYSWNGLVWVDLSQVVVGAILLRGNITNANTNPSFPATPVQGDSYFITTNAGTIGTIPVGVGDQLIFDGTAWFIIEANVQDASMTLKGVARFGTQLEVDAGLTNVIVAPDKMKSYVSQNFARRLIVAVGALAANTPTIVTHNFNVANFADVVVEVTATGKGKVELDVDYTSANTVTITSLATYSGVRVVFVG